MTDVSKHFFSKNTDPESNRVPRNGGTPRVSDTLVGAPGSPNRDYHTEALANALVDTEAGAIPDIDEGGIVHLQPKR